MNKTSRENITTILLHVSNIPSHISVRLVKHQAAAKFRGLGRSVSKSKDFQSLSSSTYNPHSIE